YCRCRCCCNRVLLLLLLVGGCGAAAIATAGVAATLLLPLPLLLLPLILAWSTFSLGVGHRSSYGKSSPTWYCFFLAAAFPLKKSLLTPTVFFFSCSCCLSTSCFGSSCCGHLAICLLLRSLLRLASCCWSLSCRECAPPPSTASLPLHSVSASLVLFSFCCSSFSWDCSTFSSPTAAAVLLGLLLPLLISFPFVLVFLLLLLLLLCYCLPLLRVFTPFAQMLLCFAPGGECPGSCAPARDFLPCAFQQPQVPSNTRHMTRSAYSASTPCAVPSRRLLPRVATGIPKLREQEVVWLHLFLQKLLFLLSHPLLYVSGTSATGAAVVLQEGSASRKVLARQRGASSLSTQEMHHMRRLEFVRVLPSALRCGITAARPRPTDVADGAAASAPARQRIPTLLSLVWIPLQQLVLRSQQLACLLQASALFSSVIEENFSTSVPDEPVRSP
ncbi:unnamed protein product, partial [Rangifer tarandus platyrhynchus]